MAAVAWFAVDPLADERLSRVDRRVLALGAAIWLSTWLWRVSRP
jgi:hypothetical protein